MLPCGIRIRDEMLACVSRPPRLSHPPFSCPAFHVSFALPLPPSFPAPKSGLFPSIIVLSDRLAGPCEKLERALNANAKDRQRVALLGLGLGWMETDGLKVVQTTFYTSTSTSTFSKMGFKTLDVGSKHPRLRPHCPVLSHRNPSIANAHARTSVPDKKITRPNSRVK